MPSVALVIHAVHYCQMIFEHTDLILVSYDYNSSVPIPLQYIQNKVKIP